MRSLMKRLFGRVKPPISKEDVVINILNSHPFCRAMNREGLIKSIKEGYETHYIIPHQQSCFNYGQFTLDEFMLWVDGKGPIVKGGTQEEKDKFMYYAEMYKELDLNLYIYFEHLHLLKDNLRPSLPSRYNDGEPIKDDLSEEEIIIEVLSTYVPSMKEDFHTRDHNTIRREWNEVSWGVIKTLMLLGYGYSGANNLPEEITNLSWAKDLVYAKAYYLYLVEKGIEIPDIEFVDKNRYTELSGIDYEG